MDVSQKQITTLVLHQLHSYWIDIDEQLIASAIPDTLSIVDESFYGLPNKRFFDGEKTCFSPYMSVQYMIFLYRLSRVIYKRKGSVETADQVYYLNKIMHGNDWFYAIDLPVHFLCEHPLGSVLGRAKYGDYFFVYQGTTVGGNRSGGKLCYPVLGNNVTLYANATVLGDSHIGDNVLISANSYLLNETIPSNSIVFGKTPSIIVKKKTEQEIKEYNKHIWGWD